MTLMHVNTVIALAPKLSPEVSVLFRGPHGIGKSQIIRQIARKVQEAEGLKEYPVIDRRLGQMSEGDVIGLPFTDGKTTRFNPPVWYMEACERPVALFLDEINRATPEVMQSAFQICLDKEMNGWKLHPQTRVFAAVNVGSQYTVNEMDAALLDRFWVVDLSPTTEDWLVWAKNSEILPDIVDFIAAHSAWLHPPKSFEPGTIHPTPRSWERVSNNLKHSGLLASPTDPLLYSFLTGFVGTEAASAFVAYLKENDFRFTGEDIVNEYTTKVKKKFKKANSGQIADAVEKAATAVDALKEVTDAQGKNLRAFMEDLGHEARLNFFQKIITGSCREPEKIRQIHKHTIETIVTGVFGVPLGKEGMKVEPKIPGFLQEKK